MGKPTELPSVYDYLDYRVFLRDHYAASKELFAYYSFRYFSRKAGLSSTNFLKLVMDGKRNLGPTTVRRFAKALKLDADEAVFFADLVTFGTAETVAERNLAFERVAANRRFRRAKRLDGALFKYLTHWYYPAVRELAGRADFRDDPSWIAKQLMPSITVRQARAALKALCKLGLLVEDDSGQLVRGETTLATSHEVRSLVIPAYHRQMIERAAAAVDDVPVDERDISAITVCIQSASLPQLKARLRRFREVMLDTCDAEEEPDRVYQLCIQFFPLSQTVDEPAP